MKKNILCLLLISSKIFSQTPYQNPSLWHLVWEDNFDYLDQNKWLVNHLAIHGQNDSPPTSKDERQIYLNQNVSINNGKLILTVRKENFTCPTNPASICAGATGHCYENNVYEYTSGWVESKDSYNSEYGYIEARIKFPCKHGYWPAFWTFVGRGLPGPTTANEIDIAEMFGNDGPNKVGNTIHTDYIDGTSCFAYAALRPDLPAYEDQFRTFGVLWSPFNIAWYYENQLINIMPNQGINDPARIILNFALGKNSETNKVTTSTPFPAKMEVDFVKVYKRNGGAFKKFWGKTHWIINKEYSWPIKKVPRILKKDDFWPFNMACAYVEKNICKYFTLDIDGNGKDEIIEISSNENSPNSCKILSYQSNNLITQWTNNSNDLIKWWNINSSDKFVSGDFNNDGKDDLLCISAGNLVHNWSQLYTFNNGDWQQLWANNGNDHIKYWNINPSDKFVSGDFNNDGKDDLLCISNGNWSQLYSLNNGDWQQLWANNGNGKIGDFELNTNFEENYVKGDFNNDGKEDLMCINNHFNFWSEILTFENGLWKQIWNDGQKNKLRDISWTLNQVYLVGKFIGDGTLNFARMDKLRQIELFSYSD